MKAASSLTASHMRKIWTQKYIQNIVSSKKQTVSKFNLASALNWSKSKPKVIKTKDWALTFSSRRETIRFHVLESGHVLYMRSYVWKDISRFRLPSWGRRSLLLRVPNVIRPTLFHYMLRLIAFINFADVVKLSAENPIKRAHDCLQILQTFLIQWFSVLLFIMLIGPSGVQFGL